MTEQPTYLPLLQAIANAERQGYEYFHAWYEHAQDPDLKETVRIVANRELEHSLAFTKRIDELGFELEPRVVIDFSQQLEVVTSDCSDYEKVQAVGFSDITDPILDPDRDILGGLLRDLTIDVQTGALLGRYIAEERDTARRLAACAEAIVARYGETEADGDESDDRLARVEAKLDAVCAAIEQLQATAAAKPVANGTSRAKGKAKAESVS
jgi:rubrerythrin